ncbi:hypothetical protein [Bradyrhizobium sp.]|uniref:hypothetical protein n=1 Tax=Bradyrhizobium sp. TaxID=376 RepID=UPI003C755D0E
MPMIVLTRFLIAASICIPLLASAVPALAQSGGSQLTAAQTVKPADFSPTERDYYQKLDAAAANSFIATRSYVRLCQQVLDHKLPALQLPDKPAGFTVKYLLPEDPNVINRALAAYVVAKQNPNHAASGPKAALEMTPAQILKSAELTGEELTYYKTLTEPAMVTNFILTRSYARLAQKVIDHKMPALQLPDKPLGFTRNYLLPGEEAVINKAIGASLAALMKKRL